jgi:hypothetical protein
MTTRWRIRRPEAQIYGSLGELHMSGLVKRTTKERDALFVLRSN